MTINPWGWAVIGLNVVLVVLVTMVLPFFFVRNGRHQ
jgi:hypothetical protein